MNFKFKEGDFARFRNDSLREPRGTDLELVKEFVEGVFRAKAPDGTYLRVRTSELVRVKRPSDGVHRQEVEARKALKEKELRVRADRVRRNQESFANMADLKVPLKPDGLPDKRYKPRYSIDNVPWELVEKARKHWKGNKRDR